MRLAHRVHTTATAGQVWELLGDPTAWPRFDLFLRRVDGVKGPARAGQRLMALGLVAGLRIPVDVLEVEAPRRLVLLIHTAPGLRETLTFEVTTAVRGGCDIEVAVAVDGPFAGLAVGPLYLAGGLMARLLAARADRLAREARGVA